MERHNAIEVKQLSYSSGATPILNGVTLQLEQGRFYAILGPNGSGKTTLLRAIAKLIEPQCGSILIQDTELQKLSRLALARQMAVVPQHTDVDFAFSVAEIVLMGRSPYQTGWFAQDPADLAIAQQAMEMTDTWHLRERSIQTLSGGERQRVIVARAIAQQTGIILLDEPVSHLDLQHQIQLLKQLQSLNQTQGITVLTVLHDINMAAAFGDVLILMRQGQIYRQGAPNAILQAELIQDVYQLAVRIIANPATGKPVVIPII